MAVLSGITMTMVGFSGLALASDYHLLVALMTLLGFGTAFAYTPVISLLAAWFPERRGAVIGVANELYRTGGFSWTTLVVAIGYPMYFVLRKKIGIDNLGGLWLDMLLMVPVALWFVMAGAHVDLGAQRQALYALVPLMGIISAAAGLAYILASRL